MKQTLKIIFVISLFTKSGVESDKFRIMKAIGINCYISIIIFLCWGCTQSAETKHYNFRKNLINVRDKVKEVEIEDVFIGRSSECYFMDQYLIIIDSEPWDKVIHLFDKNSFNYITSTADRGPGPRELTIPGEMGVNEADRIFYVSDHGKQLIYCFALDSVLASPHYFPTETIRMNRTQFPSNYLYFNDTLSIGRFIQPIGNNDYRPGVARWNMRTGEVKFLNKNAHPKIERKRITFSASFEYGVFVECYLYHDLMTLCDLDGNLKYYIYGSKWDTATQNSNFFRSVAFCRDKIVALYVDGQPTLIKDKDGGISRGDYPTKFIIFDINGDYIQTLETGYKIFHFCYDKENNRIFMILDDEIQFASLDLDGII